MPYIVDPPPEQPPAALPPPRAPAPSVHVGITGGVGGVVVHASTEKYRVPGRPIAPPQHPL
eukprot:10256609-Lingulodinium_polyedra.AAC.1